MTMGNLMKEHRPWGAFTVLEEQLTHKVKRIEVMPGQRLSYQKHEKRHEHWVIVAGRAVVTLDGKDVSLSPGQSIDVPRGAFHRVANSGSGILALIEIQRGAYFGEDDIIRLEDDYGRVEKIRAPGALEENKGKGLKGEKAKRKRR
jgi:mannose-6-phosphate isomerase-like protein (cupin superfamily)